MKTKLAKEILNAWKLHKEYCRHGCKYFREFEDGYILGRQSMIKQKNQNIESLLSSLQQSAEKTVRELKKLRWR